MRCQWLLLLLLISVVGCASQSGPQSGGVRLPNCHIHAYGSAPVWGCNTSGMTIPIGR
jgi:hypothetical protein